MAWPTRSKLLAIVHRTGMVSGTWYSLGGPAAGHVWLCKMIGVYNGSGSTRITYIAIVRGGQRYNIATLGPLADRNDNWLTNVVLEAGDTLEFAIGATFTATIDVQVHGALLG